MTVHARGAKAACRNAGVYSARHVKEGYTFVRFGAWRGFQYLLQWNVAAVVLVFSPCLFFSFLADPEP